MELIIPPNVNLETLEVASCDQVQQYWTPENPGEKKRLFFYRIEERTVLDQKTNEPIELACAVFVDSAGATIVNGSKRLVAVFENNDIKPGTPVQVTYKGKKQNRTNGNKSDDWSVVTLALKVKS